MGGGSPMPSIETITSTVGLCAVRYRDCYATADIA